MRIAYLMNQYPLVSHTFFRREIQELERQGVEVTRFAMRGWKGDIIDPQDKAERERTHYVLRGGALPLLAALVRQILSGPVRFLKASALTLRIGRRAERPLSVHIVYLAEACLIAQWMRQNDLEHLHAHFGTNPATVAMLVGILSQGPWSFTVHGPEEFDKPDLIALREKLRRCSFAVAISSFGRSQMLRLVDSTLWEKVKVVHCGLEPEMLTRPIVPIGSSPRVVCVGRLCQQKAQLLLIEAARRLKLEGCAFELVLAGDGDLRRRIEMLIAEYDLEACVRITGWLSSEEVAQEIEKARALVLPSFAEGLPVVIMEAMALGRPVISTYVAGIPELVQDGQHGWLVPAADVGALVSAIKDCLNDDGERLAQFSTLVRERVSQRHDQTREASKLIALFNNHKLKLDDELRVGGAASECGTGAIEMSRNVAVGR